MREKPIWRRNGLKKRKIRNGFRKMTGLELGGKGMVKNKEKTEWVSN